VNKVLVSAVAVFISAGVSAMARTSPAPAVAQDAALVAKGAKVYEAQKCSLCHAIAGKGNKTNPLDGVGRN
jgi:mono/diheme cytochrome c family protein